MMPWLCEIFIDKNFGYANCETSIKGDQKVYIQIFFTKSLFLSFLRNHS